MRCLLSAYARRYRVLTWRMVVPGYYRRSEGQVLELTTQSDRAVRLVSARIGSCSPKSNANSALLTAAGRTGPGQDQDGVDGLAGESSYAAARA
eukprot:1889326-Rhodomonas_salina.1